jgi:hypothetical protein
MCHSSVKLGWGAKRVNGLNTPTILNDQNNMKFPLIETSVTLSIAKYGLGTLPEHKQAFRKWS